MTCPSKGRVVLLIIFIMITYPLQLRFGIVNDQYELDQYINWMMHCGYNDYDDLSKSEIRMYQLEYHRVKALIQR